MIKVCDKKYNQYQVQSFMSNPFQSNEGQFQNDQLQNRQNQGKQQSNEPAKTKQINKGRPKKKVEKVLTIYRSQGEEQLLNNEDANQRESLFNRTVLNIQGYFIEFFQGIDERKGFIYCRQFREKLKKSCSQSTDWTMQQTWDPDVQMNKLNTLLPNEEQQNDQLRKLMLEVSSLHASEFTEQFYHIFFRVYSILKEYNHKNHEVQIKKLAKSISTNEDNKYPFFSRQFRKKVKQTKKFPFRPLQSDKPYVDLLLKLANDIKSFLF